MSDTAPVDIQINDKIDGSVATAIEAIAEAARDADQAVARLRAQLSGLDGSSVTKLTSAIDAQTKSYLDQETAINRAIAAEQKAIKSHNDQQTSAQKLAAAVAQTNAAQLNSEAALNAAAAAEQRATATQTDGAAAAIEKARATELAAAAQAEYNKILNVGTTGGSARASASVFIADAKAQADAAASAKALQVAEDAAAAARQRVIAGITTEAATFGQSRSAQLAYKAAQAGVTDEAAPFIAKIADAEKAVHSFTLTNAGSVREILVLGREMGRGNWSQFGGSLSRLAQLSGALDVILSPLGLSIIAIGVSLLGVIAIMYKAESQITKINSELKATNDFAGLTAGGFKQMAAEISDATGTRLSKSTDALNTLVASGKVSGATLRYIAESATVLSQETGDSAGKISQDFLKMTSGVASYAAEFNSQHHVLTETQYEWIALLEKRGQKEAAEEALSKTVWENVQKNGTQNLGYLEKAINSVGKAWDALWDKITKAGRTQTPEEQLSAINAQIAAIQAAQKAGTTVSTQGFTFAQSQAMDAAILKSLQGQSAEKQKQVDLDTKAAKAQSDKDKAQQTAIEAEADLTGQSARFFKNSTQLADAWTKIKTEIEAIRKVNPNSQVVQEFDANPNAVYQRLQKTYDTDDYNADNKAAAAAKLRAAAIAELNEKLKNEFDLVAQGANKNNEQKAYDQIEQDLLKKHIDLTSADNKALSDSIKLKLSNIAAGTRANDMAVEIQNIKDHTANLKLNSAERKIQEQLDAKDDAEFNAGKGRFSPQQLALMKAQLLTQQQINEAAKIADQAYDNTHGSVIDVVTQLRIQHQYEANVKAMYDQIDQYRKLDIISETEAAQAKAAVDNLLVQERLSNAQGFFTQMSQLQNNSNRELAAIGKAAAIAQATIDAYLAINKALATLPPPWNIAMAAAIGVTAFANVANIAGIKFADGGMIRGPGGPRSDSIPIWASNGEYMMTAAATRANLPLLEAMNAGGRFPQTFDANKSTQPQSTAVLSRPSYGMKPNITIEDHGIKKVYELASYDESQIRLMARDEADNVVVKRVDPLVSSHIGNPNSRTSAALGRHTKTQRRRD